MSNTIIQIKNSGVAGNVPATLQPGELAINYFDGQLFYGNTLSQAVPFTTVTEPSGLNGELQFNDSGSFGGDSGLTYNKTTNTLNVSNVVLNSLNVGPINITSNVTQNSLDFSVASNVAMRLFNDGILKVKELIEIDSVSYGPLSLSINPSNLMLTFNSNTTINPFEISGGSYPLTFSIISGTLPNGLTLDSRTGEITGNTSGV
jgi:hypothetical protein